MALNLYTNPNTPPTTNPGDWNNFVAREDGSNRGTGTAIDTISLTNWDASTTVPAIAQGSVIEVGGSLYLADSDTALVDEAGLADGAVHIKLVPSGGTVIPTLTSDSIPAWDAVKGGWYDSDDKFLPFEMTRSGAITKVYSAKKRFPYQNKTYSFSSVGALDIDGAVTATNGVFSGNVSTSGSTQLGADSESLKTKTITISLNSSGYGTIAASSVGVAISNVIGIASVFFNSGGTILYDGSFGSPSIDNTNGVLYSSSLLQAYGRTFAANGTAKVTIFYI